jgi:hypothetical protein
LLTGDPARADWRPAWFYSYFREGRTAAPTVTAVRTEAAKLIRYPGHDEWTELFDLRADPYETKNLFVDPTRADLRRELETEYDRQARAVEYRVPDFADEKTLPPEPKPLNAWVLDFRFDQDASNRVVDASGRGNDGTNEGTKLAAGGKGREFDGRGYINVKNSEALDPSVGPWTVEATIRSDAADGMILARGGQSNGYALYLVDGKPTFTCTTPAGRRTIAGKESIQGTKTVVTARLTAQKRMALFVDGKEIAQMQLNQLIARDPNDDMQIGTDLRSPVVEQKVPGFRGIIDRIRLFSGEAPAE